jgi:hypothetical protein
MRTLSDRVTTQAEFSGNLKPSAAINQLITKWLARELP